MTIEGQIVKFHAKYAPVTYPINRFFVALPLAKQNNVQSLFKMLQFEQHT